MTDSNKKKKPKYKILLIGDTLVGKTSMIQRYCDGLFEEGSNISTIGCDFKTKEMPLENTMGEIEIWDTAGQEKFKAMTKNMFKGADGFILTYDITNLNSYKSVLQWINDIKTNAQEKSRLVLAANKIDLENDRVVTKDQGKKLAQQFKIPFFETSCKKNININEIFIKIVREIEEYNKANLIKETAEEGARITAEKTAKKKKCC